MNLREVYKDKKVFITGHTGFKGSWLLAWLNILGAQIKGYALAPENDYDLYNAINGNTLCQSVIANILNPEILAESVREFEPDVIFHLAAQPLVRLSYELPADTFSVNAIGSAHVLDAVRKVDKQCVVVMITTDKVYHNYETGHAYSEEDRLGGYDPYSASKACAELIIDSYRNSFFNPANYSKHHKSISTARAGNVIGGGDWATDRIIPDIIRALAGNEPLTVRNPLAVRPWQHVLDPLHGYLVLAAHQLENPLHFSQAYNFGPYTEDALTVKELVEKTLSIWDSGSYITPEILDKPHEAGLLQLNISKALSQLSWAPLYNSSKAIELTLNWYKQFVKDNTRAREITCEQINEFMSELS